jgi:O-antigen/teichoic acid export membrane protein
MKAHEKKTDIVKNIMIYMPSRYFSQFLGIFTSILIKRFLGPLYTGMWSFLRIVVQYADYTELGATLSIFYKIPYHNGQGNTKEADSVRDNVFSFILLSSSAAALIIIAYALLFCKNLSREMFFGLLGAAVIVIAEKLFAVHVMLLRVDKNYKILSGSVYFDAALNLSLVLLVVSRFKFYGMIFITILIPIANMLFIIYHKRYIKGIAFAWQKIISYIKFGFPLYITGILNGILNNVDNIILVGMLGFKELGIYSIAMMAKNYSRQVSVGFGHVVGPYFMEDYGKYGDSKLLHAYVAKGTFAIASFMSIVLGLVFIFSTPVITAILPSFVAGLPALRISLIASFFVSLIDFPYDYIVALKQRSSLIFFTIATLALDIALTYLLIKAGLGINGAAIAATISAMVYMLALFMYCMKGLITLREAVRFFAPLIYSILVVLLLERYIVLPSIWVSAFAKAAMFLLASLVTFVMLEKETGIIKISFGLVKKYLGK